LRSGDSLHVCFRIPGSPPQEPLNARVTIKNIKPEKLTYSKLGLEYADKKLYDNLNFFSIQSID
jgi:hypothetical protein